MSYMALKLLKDDQYLFTLEEGFEGVKNSAMSRNFNAVGESLARLSEW